MTRILTKEEIIQLADEYEALDQWNQVRDWALKYYGEGAVTVDVEIEYKFNDGDPEYPSVESFSVQDADGKEMLGEYEEDEDEGYDEVREELPATEEGHEYDLTKPPTISYPDVLVLDVGEHVTRYIPKELL